MKKLNFKLLIITFLFTISMGNAQIIFDHPMLKMLNEIATKSTYTTMLKVKDANMTLVSDEKNKDGNNVLTYSVPGGMAVQYCYSAENEKLIYMIMTTHWLYASNFTPAFQELVDKDFEQDHDAWKTINKNQTDFVDRVIAIYRHKDHPYYFAKYFVDDDFASICVFSNDVKNPDDYMLKKSRPVSP